MNLAVFSDILKLLLQLINIIVIGYGFYKFLNKPHDSLADEVKQLKAEVIELELKVANDEKSIDASHIKHREQDKTNAMLFRVMLSFINFEIAYCYNTGYKDNADLMQAKKDLEKYLAGDHS